MNGPHPTTAHSAGVAVHGIEDTVPDSSHPPVTAFVVPHTHWDREWYRPFQVFRARLVEVVDQVLDLLEHDPSYRRFTLDGQAVVLEDYLELRPERRDAVLRQVRAGRLRIGPWYVLADEFLVSPEALVRNLQSGRRICATFGTPMAVGYTPDSFGHISQLPLIVRGFGLDSIVFERGVGDEGERLRGEFTWLAADGETDVFAVHLLGTYSAAAGIGHADWELTDDYDADRAAHQARAVLFGADGDLDELPTWLRESFERLPRGIAPYSTNGAVLLLNGSDHLFPQHNLPAIVADLNRRIPEAQFVHADIEEFLEAARAPRGALETHRGEFRGSRYQHVLSGVLSARLYLKQANEANQTLLEAYAEPLAALAWLAGRPHPTHLLREAWRKLLQNHPHDSICGCSVDDVHDEMMVRFDNARQLGRLVATQALTGLTSAPGLHAVAVFNPLPHPQRTTVEHTLDLPNGSASRLVVEDENGTAVPCQVRVASVFPPGASDHRVDRTTVRFEADLPALGIRGYRLSEGAPDTATAPAVRLARQGDHVTLENDTLRVDLDESGRVTLTHLESGARHPLELAFEDVADAGDTYDFSPLPGDVPIVLDRTVSAPDIIDEGPLALTVRLHYRTDLPARLSEDRSRREGRVELPLRLDLTLRAHDPSLHLDVTVDNRAEDHRLQLKLSTHVASETVLADGHFDVVERSVQPPSGRGWFQAPQPTSHQRRFVAVADGTSGLALLNRGLPEYQASASDDGVELRVTLLRCVGWLSRNDLRSRPQGAGPSLPTPGAQMPGPHTFQLAVLPFAGPWDESGLPEQAQVFVAPPLTLGCAVAPASTSWLELPRPLTLSAVKHAEDRDSLIVRVFNPSTHVVAGALRLWAAPAAVHEVSLAEERLATLPTQASTVDLTVGPKHVLTLEIVPMPPKGGSEASRRSSR